MSVRESPVRQSIVVSSRRHPLERFAHGCGRRDEEDAVHPSLFDLLVRNGVDQGTAHRVIARVRSEVLSRRPLSAPVAQLLREARSGVAPVHGRVPGSAVRLYTPAQAPEAHFPLPADRTGDLPNRNGSPGGNDSIWIDLGYPVQAAGGDPVWTPLSPLELRVLTRRLLDRG